jgi:VanZ family protein
MPDLDNTQVLAGKPRDTAWIEPRVLAITFAVVAMILYGSLYPFEFYPRGGFTDAVRYLLSTPTRWFDRGDALSNILLYIPLGIFGARAIRRVPAALRIPAITLVGAMLSISVEITQFWDVGRAPELSDVETNVLGTLAGSILESILRREHFPGMRWRPFVILLIGSQVGAWLYPFIPSIHPSRFIRAFEATWRPVAFEPLLIFKATVFWLALGLLLEALAGAARSRVWLPVMALFVLILRLTIPYSGVIRPDVTGAIVGVALWTGYLWKARWRVQTVAIAFAVFVVVDALRPFTFLATPRPFGWSPFLAFMNGPRGGGSHTFLEKSFIYGTLVWLFVQAGGKWARATIAACALVLASRVAQMWLPGRSAEITDPLMVLILAVVLRVLGD